MHLHHLRWILLTSLLAVFGAAGQSAPVIYRSSQLAEAQKKAIAEQKPLAWIATTPEYLSPVKDLMSDGSHAATQYAIRALQKDAVLVFTDAFAENHRQVNIISMALHTPKMHYDIPNVIVVTPGMDLVLCKLPYTADKQARINLYTEALKKIRDKDSWYKKTPRDKETEKPVDKEKPGNQ